MFFNCSVFILYFVLTNKFDLITTSWTCTKIVLVRGNFHPKM